ncbi:endonuclease domain-containing protein [Anaeromyxobacter oryzae]|uniref:DUF559 domain-containing protein n=1 Tax=Anaeromyxobacter oryzae TaxID=2918170 RepID=A0ABM7WTI1_9BACT|nr:endonuclease domain-containing protein [Anaeromyxobacter oryzae]BDG02791.1 hypothetical protein AMOR_17870 [Anaeromyxobacter oryzae]
MGVPSEPVAFRRALRGGSTDAEAKLWRVLRDRRLGGVKFRRQHPVGPYVLDFFCRAHRLAVELDGGQHYTPEGEAHDARRTEWLAERGIRVIRFTDAEALRDTDTVLQVIWDALGLPSG